MTAKELGEQSAYPLFLPHEKGLVAEGMTIRMELAARAMQGLVSNSTTEAPHRVVVEHAVALADHLLAELAKEQT